MTEYDFTKTPCNVDRLTKEINTSAIVTALDHINLLGSALAIFFKATLSSGDETILNSLVTAHDGTPLVAGNYPDYNQTKYTSVAASTTDDAGGVVIPNAQKIGVYAFRGNGSDPNAYFVLAWDWGGAAEKILASTRGDINISLDVSIVDNQFTGNGTKKLSIILINDSNTASQIIGGSWEAVKI